MALHTTLGLILGSTYLMGKPDYSLDTLSLSGLSYNDSLSTYIDANNLISFCPNNLLVHSNVLDSQRVKTIQGRYILTFYGSGTIALSGTVSNTLVGNTSGARSTLVIYPTAGELTLTVTGDVYDAQLELVTYTTTPSTYKSSGSKPYYGPRIESGELLFEVGSDNLVTNCTNPVLANTLCTIGTIVDQYPDGSNQGPLWTRTSTSAAYSTYSISKTTEEDYYSFSMYIKKTTGRYVTLALSSSAATLVQATFDLDTATVINITGGPTNISGHLVSANIEQAALGFFRVWVRAYSDTSTTLNSIFSFSSSTTPYIDTILSTGKYWGLQLEKLPVPTSIILNTGYRSSDIMYLNFLPENTKGTLVVAYKERYASVVPIVAGLLDITTNTVVTTPTITTTVTFNGASVTETTGNVDFIVSAINYYGDITPYNLGTPSLMPLSAASYRVTQLEFYINAIDPASLV